jgi:hypothetical protein
MQAVEIVRMDKTQLAVVVVERVLFVVCGWPRIKLLHTEGTFLAEQHKSLELTLLWLW